RAARRGLVENVLSLLSVGRDPRNADAEHRAPTDAVAVALDGAAVELDEVARQRQPHPEPAVAPPFAHVGAPEALKQVGQEIRLDALAVVGHDGLDLSLVLADAQRYPSPLG